MSKSEDHAAPFAGKGTVYVYGRAHTHPPNSLTLPHEIDPFSVFGSFDFARYLCRTSRTLGAVHKLHNLNQKKLHYYFRPELVF
jgi:hypothetical protein